MWQVNNRCDKGTNLMEKKKTGQMVEDSIRQALPLAPKKIMRVGRRAEDNRAVARG